MNPLRWFRAWLAERAREAAARRAYRDDCVRREMFYRLMYDYLIDREICLLNSLKELPNFDIVVTATPKDGPTGTDRRT